MSRTSGSLSEVPIVLHVIFICGAGPQRKCVVQNQEHLMNRNKRLATFLLPFHLTLKKKCSRLQDYPKVVGAYTRV